MSRTFGDIEAKRERFGGNPNVVIAVPDIKEFTIDDKMDFLLLGCKFFSIFQNFIFLYQFKAMAFSTRSVMLKF